MAKAAKVRVASLLSLWGQMNVGSLANQPRRLGYAFLFGHGNS